MVEIVVNIVLGYLSIDIQAGDEVTKRREMHTQYFQLRVSAPLGAVSWIRFRIFGKYMVL